MYSQFLPKDFDSKKPIAVIAGSGLYPELTVKALKKHKLAVSLVAFEEETSAELLRAFPEDYKITVQVGQLGKLLKALKNFGVGYAIMAGQVTPRRLFDGLVPDLKAIMLLAKLKKRNAETIFGAIAEEIENMGVKMLDARAFLDDQLADEGVMAGVLDVDSEYIEHGVEIAKEMARLDVGQGIVVRKGTILAVEAFEGTDQMLKRAGQFKADGSVFIKTVKPKHDYRFDVPVFGLKTIQSMVESGIRYAGLEARNTLILEKEKVLKEAAMNKLTLFGYKSNEC